MVSDGEKTGVGTRLALRPREAAKALGVCDRTLWTWTRDGVIPYIRQGKTILYPISALNQWLEDQAKAQTAVQAGPDEDRDASVPTK